MNNNLLREAAQRHPEKIMSPYDAIAEMNGFDAICAFCDMMGGSTVYIPHKRTVFRCCLEAEALREFDGKNYLEIALKYGLGIGHVRRIVKANKQ